MESSSTVCITPLSQVIISYKKNSVVCISPRSQTPRCASHHRVHNLPNVCFDPKFYKFYFSVVPEYENNTASHELFKESFLHPKFSEKRSRKALQTQKHKKWTYSSQVIKISQKALRCASHRGVNLRCVYHTAESNCTPQSQNWNLCDSLVTFKGTIRRNRFRGEHIYHERKELNFFFLLSLQFWIRGESCTQGGVKFLNFDWISTGNRNRIRK